MIQQNIAAIKKYAKSKGSQRIAHHGIFLFLELNSSNSLDLNYSKYPGFNLENISEDDCIAEFRFRKKRYILT